MLITVFSIKGGTGKDFIAYALALHYNALLSTNDADNSYVVDIYPKFKEEITYTDIKDEHVIFNSGGFKDKNTQNIINVSDVVIVPLTIDYNSVKSISSTFEALKDIPTKKIIIAINIAETKRDVALFKSSLQKNPAVRAWKAIHLRKSKAALNIYNEKKSIHEMSKISKLHQRWYRGINADFNKLIACIDEATVV